MNSFFHISLNRNPPGCFNADVPHVHGHNELLYCTSGKGGQIANYEELPLEAGDLYFFPAKSRHCSVFLSGHEFECYVLAFEDSLFTPALPGDRDVLSVIEKMGFFKGKVPLDERSRGRLEPIFEVLLIEFQKKCTAYHAALKMLTMRLLIAIARDTQFLSSGEAVCVPPSNEKMIHEVLAYIETYYMHTITIDSVLEFCPISRSHFHAIFKRMTGKTFMEQVTDTRVEKAKELLVNTDYNITKVAQQTGFSSPAYFGQTFRTVTGKSPGEFRKHQTAKRPDT